MPQTIDLTGQRFGELLVIEQAPAIIYPSGKRSSSRWLCRCSCGRTLISLGSNLKRTTSCKKCFASRILDLTGMRFGHLTAMSRDLTHRTNNKVSWICKCDCGAIKTIASNSLRTGNSKSCGCSQVELAREALTTHGATRTKLYQAWSGMIQRCTNPKHKNYHTYGGRGIAVCDEWRNSFERFRDDMGPKPSPTHSIDRIDNAKGYSADNCRWATPKEQSQNSRASGPRPADWYRSTRS